MLRFGDVKQDILQKRRQDRMQAPGADILDVGIDLRGDLRDCIDRLRREFDTDSFRHQERLVLFDKGVLRLRKDPDKVLFGEARQSPQSSLR